MELPEPVPSDSLILALTDIESTATQWLEISQGLKKRESELKDLQAGWLMTAFDYSLARRVRDASRNEAAFVPSMGWETVSYPLALPLVPDIVLELWSNVVDRSDGMGSQARLRHLLFERRHGNPGDHARAAAAAYLSIGVSDWPRIERVNCLHWSLDLSCRIKDDARAKVVHAPLVAIAQESLSQKDPEPGVALHALEVLVNDTPDHALLPELLLQARAAYPTPWLADETIRLQLRLAKGNGGQIAALKREQVRGYLHAADQSAGMLRMANLEDAAKLATSFGIADLLQIATEGMQAMTIEDMEFQKTTIEFSLPSDVFEGVIGYFVNQSTLAAGLLALITADPPTGNLDRNTENAAKTAKAAPFMDLLTKKHVGNDALTRYTADDEDERLDEKLAEQENFHMIIGAEIAARSLDGLMAKFAPSSEELFEIIGAGEHVSDGVSESLAKALLAFHNADWEQAATLSMPRIETLARVRLAVSGDLQFEVQRGHKRGQYPQLSRMLVKLKGHLDGSWHRYLWTFLVSPFGRNFRNELAHGFVEQVGVYSSALTLIAALHLALAPVQAAANASGEASSL